MGTDGVIEICGIKVKVWPLDIAEELRKRGVIGICVSGNNEPVFLVNDELESMDGSDNTNT